MTILSQMETALQMEDKEVTKLFGDGTQSMRMNYYPPCPLPAEVIGLTPHSDSVGLTILLQVNEMDGLQVKKDEIWVPVKPLPDAFIVNVGDILEIRNKWCLSQHRASGNTPSLVTEQTPAAYTRVGVDDYFKAYLQRKLQGKSFLDELRIKY
ncbi:hypothetical protein Pyn_30071 [Prunus yedoensis var. nudiflora]|uniref:Fe2OG dioxygenase domain-containing protein n=1 Tax=Prunus yedoensis var. nudiflora TaxID=2094558 RepID=A0A314ZMQ8_PRUYE|nr:hypothetical protein Pyn_30071 [Prunus yedoensis var. nudiflora]